MKEVLQVAYLRHLQDFYLFESVKDGSIAGEECPEYWNNFIKIQGENLWKIHRFPPQAFKYLVSGSLLLRLLQWF